MHDYRVFTHPLPVVKHPDKNFEQSALGRVFGASVQARGLHTREPYSVFAVHGPSEPIKLTHPAAYGYVLQVPKVFVQPWPVVRHP